jgi:hypothetical protein
MFVVNFLKQKNLYFISILVNPYHYERVVSPGIGKLLPFSFFLNRISYFVFVWKDLAGMPLVPRFQLLGHGDPSSSNDRDLYSTPDGYRYMKGH